jgi:hypothetical protein
MVIEIQHIKHYPSEKATREDILKAFQSYGIDATETLNKISKYAEVSKENKPTDKPKGKRTANSE